jgi:hypothetical protein
MLKRLVAAGLSGRKYARGKKSTWLNPASFEQCAWLYRFMLQAVETK